MGLISTHIYLYLPHISTYFKHIYTYFHVYFYLFLHICSYFLHVEHYIYYYLPRVLPASDTKVWCFHRIHNKNATLLQLTTQKCGIYRQKVTIIVQKSNKYSAKSNKYSTKCNKNSAITSITTCLQTVYYLPRPDPLFYSSIEILWRLKSEPLLTLSN